MEEKLFWIGILVGLHFFLTQHFEGKGKFKDNKFLRAWHSAFMAIVGFVLALLAAVSFDNSRGDVVTAMLFSGRQLLFGLAGAAAGGLYGWFRMKKGRDAKDRPLALKEDLEWSETIFSAVLLASVVMYLFVQAFKIPSGSMRMTYLEGDHLFVNKLAYGIRIPFTSKKILAYSRVDRGDIVVFRFPSEDPRDFQCGGSQYGKDFIKRVVGLPGDTVEVRDGRVLVNGARLDDEAYAQYVDGFRYPPLARRLLPQTYQELWEQRELGRKLSEYVRDNFGPVTVPQGNYLVMGDNRDRSCDSRYWGPVPADHVKGKAWFTYWPISRISFAR